MNPHIRYGRSDRRGFVLMDLTPQSGTVLFQALDDVRNAGSGISTVAAFTVPDGRPGVMPGA